MPIRVPVQTVIVHRNGKNIAAPIGKPFEFTNEELAEIKAINPRAIRMPINEVSTEAKDALDALAKAEALAAQQKGEPNVAGDEPQRAVQAPAKQTRGKKGAQSGEQAGEQSGDEL